MAVLKIAAIKPQVATSAKSGDMATSVSENFDLIKSQLNLKTNEYINIKNAVKILETYSNWNGYLKIYTEVESNFKVGDIVYVTHTEPTVGVDTFNLENPSIPFANYYLGYNVLYVNPAKNEVVIDRYFNDLTGSTYKYLKNQFLSKVSCRGGNYYNDISDGVVFYDCNIIDSELAPLSGVVYGSVVSGATIRCAGLYTFSNYSGEYALNVPVGNTVINVRADGYISKTILANIKSGVVNNLDINLSVGTNSVTISTPTTNVCSTNDVTFTATCVGFNDPTAIYQWKINGVNVGTDKSTFTTNLLKNGDIVTCLVSDDLDSIESSGLNMTVVEMKTISVSIASNPNTTSGSFTYFNSGSTITLTATALNPCVGDTYTWYKNSVSAYTGSNYTYSPSNYDRIYCKINSNCECKKTPTANSNELVLKARTVSIQGDKNNICSGVGVSFISQIEGFIQPSYEWKINGTICGTTSNFYTTTLLNGNIVLCNVKDNVYGSDTGTQSNSITMAVTLTQAPSFYISGDTFDPGGDAPVPPAPVVISNNFYVDQGDSCIFTATKSFTCSAVTYNWYQNSTLLSSHLSAITLVASTEFQLKCEIVTNCACIIPSSKYSNILNVKFRSLILWSDKTEVNQGGLVTFNWASTGFTGTTSGVTYTLTKQKGSGSIDEVYEGYNKTWTCNSSTFSTEGLYHMVITIKTHDYDSNTVDINCTQSEE